jgi:hypothetical protein
MIVLIALSPTQSKLKMTAFVPAAPSGCSLPMARSHEVSRALPPVSALVVSTLNCQPVLEPASRLPQAATNTTAERAARSGDELCCTSRVYVWGTHSRYSRATLRLPQSSQEPRIKDERRRSGDPDTAEVGMRRIEQEVRFSLDDGAGQPENE